MERAMFQAWQFQHLIRTKLPGPSARSQSTFWQRQQNHGSQLDVPDSI